jgi:type III restriction enzyme
MDSFFDHPILNSPYAYPARHWELSEDGQPTGHILSYRRTAKYITPVPKPRTRRDRPGQAQFILDEGEGLSTKEQQL